MPEEDEVSLYDYIKVVSKWKWLINVGTFAYTLTAGIVTLLLPKVYETRATLSMQGSATPDVKIGILTIPSGLSLDKFVSSLPNNRDLNLEVVQRIGTKGFQISYQPGRMKRGKMPKLTVEFGTKELTELMKKLRETTETFGMMRLS